MAEYYRQELEMLRSHLADLNMELLSASCKREALMIKDRISVTKAEIRLCERDLRKEVSL